MQGKKSVEKSDMSGSTSRLVIHLPDKLWLGEFSRKYSHFRFEILSFIPISQDPFVGNSLIKITGTNPQQLLLHLENHPSMQGFFMMDESPTHITLNTQTRDDYLLKALIRNQILVKLPVIIDHGDAIFNVHSTRENIDNFIEDLNRKEIKVELRILGTYSEDSLSDSLTPRQMEIFRKAKELGYYDSPRRISLTELAEKLDIAKSSLSSMLQRLHKKLLGS
jgi:predicted DNA binding protein